MDEAKAGGGVQGRRCVKNTGQALQRASVQTLASPVEKVRREKVTGRALGGPPKSHSQSRVETTGLEQRREGKS